MPLAGTAKRSNRRMAALDARMTRSARGTQRAMKRGNCSAYRGRWPRRTARTHRRSSTPQRRTARTHWRSSTPQRRTARTHRRSSTPQRCTARPARTRTLRPALRHSPALRLHPRSRSKLVGAPSSPPAACQRVQPRAPPCRARCAAPRSLAAAASAQCVRPTATRWPCARPTVGGARSARRANYGSSLANCPPTEACAARGATMAPRARRRTHPPLAARANTDDAVRACGRRRRRMPGRSAVARHAARWVPRPASVRQCAQGRARQQRAQPPPRTPLLRQR